VAPDRPARTSPFAYAANRQGETEWPEHAAFCDTVAREHAMASALVEPGLTAQDLIARFLHAPIYRSTAISTWGTVYTAAYDCNHRSLDLLWPDDAWVLSLDHFVEDVRTRRSLVSVPPPTYAPASESLPSHPPALIF
jgi:hypothetical protein